MNIISRDESGLCPSVNKLPKIPQDIIGDSKSYLIGLIWPCSEKRVSFWHFSVGGGDIRYWLEMTSFWFIMIL